jgi:hypothetical protein
MTFPTGAGDAAIAHVEIDIVASFTPSTGLLAIDGKLSPESFLLGGFVKLFGGFAVRAWFSGPHQGDFVISLGGYHPAFDRGNYPAVPRIGLSFTLGPLKVIGESYFALTPHAFMTGLRLAATFEAGPIKVWFDAGIDFLIEWAPFHYEADAYVDFGCSIDLGLFTLTIHIGAQLQIWGPEFGGSATIDVVIVTFTIPFGATKAPPPPIGWATLAEKFLPGPTPTTPTTPTTPPASSGATTPPASSGAAALVVRAAAAEPGSDAPGSDAPAGTTNVVRADVKAGKLKADVTDAAGPLDWIIDPDHFQIVTNSAVPANHADWVTGPPGKVTGQDTTAALPSDFASYHQGLPADSTADAPAPAPAPASDTAADTAPGGPDWYLWVEPGRTPIPDDPDHPDPGQAWAPVLHVAPMAEANVAAHHVVELYRLDEGQPDYRVPVAVRPVVVPSNTAIWGPSSGQDVNAPRLIPGTLTGLEISPLPSHPDQVSSVPLSALAFQHDNPAEFAYATPAFSSTYTITIEPDHAKTSLPITVTGPGVPAQHLANDDYKLASLTNDWVTTQRDAVLDQLRTLGFSTLPPAGANLSAMAGTALTGWPAVACIGASG